MDQKRRQKLRESRYRKRQKQVRRQRIMLTVIVVIIFLAGAFVGRHLFSSEDTMPFEYSLSAECESYRTQVEEAARRYDMSEYVDLILAVMMQESSGRHVDVMQSSEGKYNTKYPQVPNGITDTMYSIECGVQELKYALETAECKGADDFERIKLALQAYNFGADAYLPYMKEKGLNSWSHESAQAFAQMASGGEKRSDDLAKNAVPWNYGDQYYPEHVLRYYPSYNE